MALVPEDGTGLPNADSYVSVSEADSYWADHGSPSSWTGAATASKESALRYATIWVDNNFAWPGEVVSDTQALRWPRGGVVDDERRPIDSDVIPVRLKSAVMQLANEHIASGDLSESETHGLEEVEAGPVRVRFVGSAGKRRAYPFVEVILRGLYAYGGGVVRTVRA